MEDNYSDNQYMHKRLLEEFWLNFNDRAKVQLVSNKNKEETLKLLREMGEIKLTPVMVGRNRPDRARYLFDKKKNRLKRFLKYRNCFVCEGAVQCRHHIIWVKNGGMNTKINIVGLCDRCHSEIHPWLRRPKV